MIKHLLPCLFALFFSACSSFSPPQYLLTYPAQNDDMASLIKNDGQIFLAIRQIQLPEYLDQDNIVYLKKSPLIAYAQGSWLTPFESNLRNLLQSQLQNQLGKTVVNYPILNNHQIKYLIDIQINTMIADAETLKFTTIANWQIIDRKSGKTALYHYSKVIDMSSITAEEITKAMSKSIQQLVEVITEQLIK